MVSVAVDTTAGNAIMIQRAADCGPVLCELLLKLESLVGKDGDPGRVSETTSVGLQESFDLFALYGYLSGIHIHSIENKNHLNSSSLSVNSLERTDGLRYVVIQNREVLLLKAAHRRPSRRTDHHVNIDPVAGVGCRMILPSGNLRPANQGHQKKKAETPTDGHALPLSKIGPGTR
jgi:hypothetical protein